MTSGTASSEAASPLPKKINLRKTTILIVDPNEFARTFIRSICRNLHFGNILTTSNTTEASELLRANQVHLVVCDWELQPLTSTEFVKQIRTSENILNSTVPVIILTSVGMPEAIFAARDAGVDDYLMRPLVMRRLLNSFVTALCMPRVYVKSGSYVGPCRRRRKISFSGQERRRVGNNNVTVRTVPPVSMRIDTKVSAAALAGGTDDKDMEINAASMEEMEKAGEAAIAMVADNYNQVRLDDIAEIFNLVRAIKEPDAPIKSILDGIYSKALDVKGMGKTFGFPLLTKVGDLLCAFVRDPNPDSFKVLAKLQVVETHAIVMKMIVDSKTQDEKDPLAVEMIADLEGIIAKFRPL